MRIRKPIRKQNDSSIENRKKRKKRKPLVPPVGNTNRDKEPAHVANPGGLFNLGWYYQPGLKVDL